MAESPLEYILTNSTKKEMILYLKSNPKDFNELVKLSILDKQPYSWRAAWLLWSCMDKNDARLTEHLEQIIDGLSTKPDNQLRELLIVLQRMDLCTIHEGKLFNICINTWRKTEKQPSVRYNAFKLIIRIIKKHPELLNEVKYLTEPQYFESLSNNVKKSVFRMIEEVKKEL